MRADLETARLLLRPPRLDDAEAIFGGYAQDAEVTRYLIWEPHHTIEETREFLFGCVEAWKGGGRFPWVILTKDDGSLIGMVETTLRGVKAEVGYVLRREAWGKGYATEVLCAVRDEVMAHPEIFRFWATCDTQNLASARVLEKAGLLREGVLKRYIVHPNLSPEPRDSFCYALTR